MDENALPETTVADLRKALSEAFPAEQVGTVMLRAREAGYIATGVKGRSGSAEITIEQAALVLLAVSLDRRHAVEALALAFEVAGYRLKAAFVSAGGRPARKDLPANGLEFGAWLAHRLLKAAADPNVRLPGLQLEPDTAVHVIDPGGSGQVIFEPDAPTPPSQAIRRVAIISPRLLAAVAALFRADEPVGRRKSPPDGLRPKIRTRRSPGIRRDPTLVSSEVL